MFYFSLYLESFEWGGGKRTDKDYESCTFFISSNCKSYKIKRLYI